MTNLPASTTKKQAEINSQILEVKKTRDHKVAELNQRKKELETNSEEMIAKKLEPEIQAGQSLEKTLQEKMGTATRKALLFESTKEVVVEAGETIDQKHISKVQQIVKAHLDDIEKANNEQLNRDLEQIKMDMAKEKAEADLRMEELRNELEDQANENSDQTGHQKDEILTLKPFSFLSESKYRELKSKYGQVFRADMGAEAFFDILHRLDLERLSEDLWKEVRTSKSKQKRKKATTRLESSGSLPPIRQ